MLLGRYSLLIKSLLYIFRADCLSAIFTHLIADFKHINNKEKFLPTTLPTSKHQVKMELAC